ncbi:peptidase M20 domain-containing protein 2 [Trichonephila clavipes]|nr:peptidase M20 domain-containing protein 2 [Trichonephila clavipes]
MLKQIKKLRPPTVKLSNRLVDRHIDNMLQSLYLCRLFRPHGPRWLLPDVGPTIAILLEYDALPEIGHACGHNLISEAGLSAAMAVKAAMEEDNTLLGKLVVMGTPAEEGGGGKIRLLELGAFEGIDAAMMVHPTKYTHFYANTLCNTRYSVTFKGKESHALLSWEGLNSLDAAVTCYMSISQLRQHIKSSSKIQAIIVKGGTVANVVPSLSTMDVHLRTPTKAELEKLQSRVEACFSGAAMATGCDVQFKNDEANSYENLITNKTLAILFEKYALKLARFRVYYHRRLVIGINGVSVEETNWSRN